MEKAIQLSVTMENQPGQLARVCRALAQAGVNIRAMSVSEASDMSTIRLVVSDPDAARGALQHAGLCHIAQGVLLVALPDEPGALERVAVRLGESGINIQYIYGSGDAGRGSALLVVRTDDPDAARQALA